MREIILVLQVPDPGDDGYDIHDPQDGDQLLQIMTEVKRGETRYQQTFNRTRAAILTIDRLVDYVGRVMANIEEHRDR